MRHVRIAQLAIRFRINSCVAISIDDIPAIPPMIMVTRPVAVRMFLRFGRA